MGKSFEGVPASCNQAGSTKYSDISGMWCYGLVHTKQKHILNILLYILIFPGGYLDANCTGKQRCGKQFTPTATDCMNHPRLSHSKSSIRDLGYIIFSSLAATDYKIVQTGLCTHRSVSIKSMNTKYMDILNIYKKYTRCFRIQSLYKAVQWNIIFHKAQQVKHMTRLNLQNIQLWVQSNLWY